MSLNAPPAEWLDSKSAFRLFNLGRTVLARLHREGKIRSCSLAEDGMDRGKRLWDASSIRDYLNHRAEVAEAVAAK